MSATKPSVVQRPGPFYGWYIVGASVFCNAVTAGTYWQGFQIFFLPLLKEFGWSRAALSGAFSFRSIETGVEAPFIGILVDRVGPRKVILWSAVLAGAGICLVGLTFDIISFYAFFLLATVGAGGASHSISWSVVITRWFRRRRGLALGIGTSGPMFAGVVLVTLAWLVETMGWRTAVVFAGVFLWLTIIPMTFLVVRDSPGQMGTGVDGDPVRPGPSERPAKGQERPEREGYTVGQALRSRPFWLVVVIFSCLFFGQSAFQVHQVAYFQNDAGLSLAEATSLLGLVFLVSAVGRIGVGFLSDFVDLRLVLAGIIAMNVMAWVYLLTIPVESFWLALPFVVIFGVPFGAMVSIRPVLLVQLFGVRSLGSMVGMFQLASLASSVVGPILMGYIYDIQGTYAPVLGIFALVSALALPFVFLVKAQEPPLRG